MKVLPFFFFLFSFHVFAENCFLVKEKNKLLVDEGECNMAFAPNSTFKIPLSLMGFDSGVFESEEVPLLKYKRQYNSMINICKTDLNPRTWMRDSCVWFSQVLTEKLGRKKFNEYVKKISYGNKDTLGDKGKENGLTHSWLSSSLLITPKEQVMFIQDMLDRKFPLTPAAYEKTKNILFNQELSGGWKLYGKTGNGLYKKDLQQGWFVGWIEKEGRKIIFAHHIQDKSQQKTYASFRSKNEVLTKLWYLINKLEAK